MINVDSELVVYRDDVTRIDATNVVVANENTIICDVDIDIDDPNTWNLVVTPDCGSQLKIGGAVLTVSCQSNFNNDLQVNFLDYAELADIWDEPCSVIDWCNGLDLDFSSRIDMGDLTILADEWLLGAYQ